jgi:F0F1-type ATP synthase membrane subunit c/vacuolar-type H+-ATPase subunit K
MHDHSEWYRLFTSFWWLIFPIGWGVFGLLGSWIKHREAQQALEVLKSYAEQGKDAPPELIQVLRGTPPEKRDDSGMSIGLSRGALLVGLALSALSFAFVVLRATRITERDPDAQGGLLFVIVLMGGLAVASFIAAFLFSRDARSNKP